jgi:hypothetical protein
MAKDKRTKPFIGISFGRSELFFAEVVQHLFHLGGMGAVGLQLEVFPQGFHRSRRSLDAATFG